MFPVRKHLPRRFAPILTSLMIGIVLLAAPLSASASNISVTVKIDGTTVSTFSGSTDATKFFASLTSGGTTFNNLLISAQSNQPGQSTAGNLAQVSITGSSSTGTGILTVEVVEKDHFTLPGSTGIPMDMKSNVSRADGQVGNDLTFQSWVKPDSTANPGLELTTGLQKNDTTLGNSADPNEKHLLFGRGTTYDLRDTLTVRAGTSSLNVNGTTAVTAMPVPGGLLLAFSGMPILGAGYLRRRLKRAKTVSANEG